MGFLESLRDRELRGLYKAIRLVENAELRLARGTGQNVRDDLEKAREILFADLQRRSPHSRDFADALVHLSMVQLKTGNVHQAMKAADRALELQDRYPPAMAARADALAAWDQLSDALTMLDGAIELRPSEKSFHLKRASVLEKSGRLPEAIQSLRRAEELDPSDIDVIDMLIEKDDAYRWTLRKAEVFLQTRRFDEAVAALDEVIVQGSRNIDVLLVKGRIMLEAERWEDASTVYDSALAIEPESYDANLGKARALRGSGQAEPSVKYYKEALRADVERKETWLEVGAVLESLERLEEAAKVYEQAVSLDPKDLSPPKATFAC